MNEWNGFLGETWKKRIDIEDFIVHNYKEYREGEKFLVKSLESLSKIIRERNHYESIGC